MRIKNYAQTTDKSILDEGEMLSNVSTHLFNFWLFFLHMHHVILQVRTFDFYVTYIVMKYGKNHELEEILSTCPYKTAKTYSDKDWFLFVGHEDKALVAKTYLPLSITYIKVS